MEKVSISLDHKAIEEEITERLFSEISETITERIDKNISKAITEGISKAVDEFISKEVPKLLDKTFTVCNEYGQTKKESTVRDAIFEQVKKQCGEYRRQSYDSDKNAITSAIDKAVDLAVKPFKEEIYKKVNTKFTDEVIGYAEERLRERLKIK